MSRIDNILLRVRDTLSDPDGERWSDGRLLRLIDDAQKAIALQANLLRTSSEVNLVRGQAVYDLPADAHRIIRVVDAQGKIPTKSHQWADTHFGADWAKHYGDGVKAIIYDKLDPGLIKVYPKPLEGILKAELANLYGFVSEYADYEVPSLYGVLTDVIDGLTTVVTNGSYGLVGDVIVEPVDLIGIPGPTEFTSSHGCIVEIDDYDLDQFNGIVVEVEDEVNDTIDLYGTVVFMNVVTGGSQNDAFGLVASLECLNSLSSQERTLEVYYYRRPSEIRLHKDKLAIDKVFDSAIKFYVCGMALRDDRDTQNRIVGNEELQFFNFEMKEALRDGRDDFNESRTHLDSGYSTGFEAT